MLPLRWSFGSKDRQKPNSSTNTNVTGVAPGPGPGPGPVHGELVEYLESGRRPRCTKEPIVPLVASPPTAKAQTLRRRPDQMSGSPVRHSPSRGGESPRVPEGQCRRPPSGPDHIGTGGREDGSLGRRTSRRSGSRGAQDLQPPSRASSAGPVHGGSHPNLPSSSTAVAAASLAAITTPPSNVTLRRAKSQQGPPPGALSRTGSPAEVPTQQAAIADQRARSRSTEAGNGQLKSSVSLLQKKKDQGPQRPRELDDKPPDGTSSSTRHPVSNGSLTGVALEDSKRPNGSIPTTLRGHSVRHSKVPTIPNGKKCHGSPAATAVTAAMDVDIKRAHSSSSLQAKIDSTLRRTASLQRNGPLVPPALPHALVTDRPSYATLQRTRYSTTSLGRPRRVPESCF